MIVTIKRIITTIFLFLAAVQALWPASAACAPESPEYLIKAGFIYNIARFVEWRDGQAPSQDLILWILGEDPFGDNIRAIEGQTVNGRRLVVHRAAGLEAVKKCHILFICPSEMERMEGYLRSLQGSTVLTIGDTPGFARMGGIINLLKVGGSIRFEVNVEAAGRAGLALSSELLKLAIIVK